MTSRETTRITAVQGIAKWDAVWEPLRNLTIDGGYPKFVRRAGCSMPAAVAASALAAAYRHRVVEW
jgi:hypothetical protein